MKIIRKQLHFSKNYIMIYKVNIKEAMELSEPKLVSPLLDGFLLGEPISDHHGVRCCPAIREDADERYIVKIISIPATQVQLDALLLTGACSNSEQALAYFKDLSDGVAGEANILERLSHLEGFVPYQGFQIQQMDEAIGYETYLVSPYKRSLEKQMCVEPLTHLAAVNMGLDMCAALTVCRQAGYLYADLKPGNIFLSDTQGYQIGDLGFIPLASLKFASLPEKYRSSYTAPEISDALSELNDTMDIYALGLILYQVYNNGQLPFDGSAPAQVLPTPMYADYEMAEIILKACAPDPKDRWQDPAQMGQALVDYMQRNSVNDTPIIPPPVIVEEPAEEAEEGFITEEQNEEDLADLLAMIPDEVPPEQLSLEPEAADPEEAEPVSDPEPDDENLVEDEISPNEAEQLSFLDEDGSLHETGVTNEVAQMLAQADDLIAHELPEPVVAPAPIDVPIPPPIMEEPEVEETEEEPVIPVPDVVEAVPEEPEPEETEEEIPAEMPAKPTKRRWIAAVIALLLLIGAGIGGSVWYNEYYLQTVQALEIHGSVDKIEVSIISEIDEDLLTAVCTDTYGNAKRSPVVEGVAVFTDLNPSTQYRIRLEISGVHKLLGQTTGSYTTADQTEIIDFSAECGPEDGSVILHFDISGPDCDQWTVAYSAPGETEQTQAFSGHRVTIYDLTVGKDYTFRLLPPTDMLLSGTSELTYTARNILYAQDLKVTACNNGSLTVQWQNPDGAADQKWIVRCYNTAGYDQTLTTGDTTLTFTNLDHTTGYTIIVTAEGMQQGASTQVSADPVNVTNYIATLTAPYSMELSWAYTGTAPAGGWLLRYSVNGGEMIEVTCPENKADIAIAPGSTYVFTVYAADDSSCFSESYTYGPVETPLFEGYGVTAANMTLSMVLRPDKADWSHNDLSDEDYKTTFAAGENASILAHLDTTYAVSNNTVVTTYVIRDSQNGLVSAETQSRTWRDMWYKRYCELDLPQMPTQADTYTVDIYFNDLYVGSLTFTIA